MEKQGRQDKQHDERDSGIKSLTIRMNVPMNSARNSRTTCRSRNLAIAVDDRSNSRAARAAAAAARLEDRDVDDATDEVDAVVVVAIVCDARASFRETLFVLSLFPSV